MRPIRLVMEAFSPFAGRAEIDFRAVAASPLYGIYGPTGGGKTSILDAICFALFGESSGSERAPEDLRSHHAAPDRETRVEFVFELGGKRYLIHRQPRQTVAKRRGSGTTERPAEAYLFDATGLSPEAIRYPENPGIALVEKKVTEVNEALTKRLGYSAAQFRQIVVLPQGRFRELLVAKSDDRSAILRQLFETGLYERLTERLKARTKALKTELDRLEDQCKDLLEQSDVDSEAALVALLEERTRACARVAEAQIQAEHTCRQVQQRHDSARQLDRRFEELEAARQALHEVTAESAAIDAQREQLRRAEAAQHADGVAKSFDDACRRHAEAEKSVEQKRLQAAQDREHCDDLDRRYAASLRAEPQRESLRVQVLALQGYNRTWEGLRDKQAALQQAQSRETRARQAMAGAGEAGAECRQRLAEARRQLERLNEARNEAFQLERRIDGLRERYKALTRIAELDRAIAEKSEQLTARRAQTGDIERQLARGRNRLDALERRFSAHAAALLAIGLEADRPCPVCGSREHPAPAAVGGTEMIDRTAIERARRQCDELQTTCAELQRQADRLATELSGLQQQRSALVEGLDRTQTPDEVADQLESQQQQLDTRVALIDQETVLHETEQDAEQDLQQAEAAQQQAAEELNEARIAAARCQENLDAALQGIPEALRDGERLPAALAEVEAELQQAVAAHETLERAHREATERSAGSAAGLRVAEAQLETARVEREQARQAFERALAEAGFKDETVFRHARLEPDEIAALRRCIDDHAGRLQSARDRHARAQQAVAGAERPDLPRLDAELTAAREAVEQAFETRTRLASALETLDKTLSRYRQKQAEYTEREARYREAAYLSQLADGRNDRRLRLVDYVLSAYLEEVLIQANLRFARMSRNRYQLRRKTEFTGGRSSTSLDITVYDAFTDQERAASTLSGGESFLAALSLALGLADVVQMEAGGIRLDAIFVDEGFGHLDEEALDEALATLADLTGSARLVGLISHVEEVKRVVPAGFDVVRTPRGSAIRPRQGTVQSTGLDARRPAVPTEP